MQRARVSMPLHLSQAESSWGQGGTNDVYFSSLENPSSLDNWYVGSKCHREAVLVEILAGLACGNSLHGSTGMSQVLISFL